MSIFRVGYDAVRQDANGVRRLRSPPVGRGTSRNPKNEGLTLNPVTLNPGNPKNEGLTLNPAKNEGLTLNPGNPKNEGLNIPLDFSSHIGFTSRSS